MTHTPGPWTLTDWNKVSNGGALVAITKNSGHVQEDARLIAAAPALLEALEEARGWIATFSATAPVLHKIEDAIALATGESK